MSGQLHAQGAGYLDHGIESGIGAGCQCLVKALAAESSVSRHLGHATCTGDIAERKEKVVEVAALQNNADVLGDRCVVIQVTGRVC